MSKNTDGLGAAQAKSGLQALPLDRHAGYSRTMEAVQSKVRSQHPHMDKHYSYESIGPMSDCCNERGQTG